MEARTIVMNGGEGPHSYFNNSKIQEKYFDGSKALLIEGIKKLLDIQQFKSKNFSIADLGCSTGPNTFSCMNTIIQAVQRKYEDVHDDEIPEFHVFFNDQLSNDFNTLFKAFPNNRQYFAYGVPGSFYGRLFPRSSMNLIHSSTSLHWLQRVPEAVMKKDSPSWNGGRITYARSCIEIVNAFRDQFFNDFKDFLNARSAELAPGGLLAVLILARPEDMSPSEVIYLHLCECFGDVLADAVKKGIIDEDLADSFNLPVFIPSLSELKELISSKEKYLSIEILQEIHQPPLPSTPEHVSFLSAHGRALLEGIITQHFGPNRTDELFHRYPQKLESFIKTQEFTRLNKHVNLFLLAKRIQ